jgi:hypothetical protein
MRVMAAVLRRANRDERGATLAIVAIALVAILGMVVLTVDLGALLVKRRGMVNANDAAALAAAETFARGLAQRVSNESPAEDQADAFATQNVSNAVRDMFSTEPFPDPAPPTCGGDQGASPCGEVSVQYHGNQGLFFASLFGIDQADVRATATAIWGPAGGGHVIPLIVTVPGLQSCGFPQGPAPTPAPQCHLGYDGSDPGNSQWGLVDLGSWNVDPTQDPKKVCKGANPNDVVQWLNDPPPESLNAPPQPTYVCSDDLTNLIWQSIPKGVIRYFPVVDPSQQVPPGNPKKNGEFFNDVVGFAPLKIIDVQDGPCGSGSFDAGSTLCLTVEDTGPIAGGSLPGGGQDFGLEAIRLSR